MADLRQQGLNLIFWKRERPSEDQIKAIISKGIGLTPKDGGGVADDTKSGVDAFMKASDQEAFIATFPPELHDVLRRIAPKKKGVVVKNVIQPVEVLVGKKEEEVAEDRNHSDAERRRAEAEARRHKVEADASSIALLQKAEAERAAAEAKKATAELEAKRAEEDRKAVEAKKATAELEAKRAEEEALAKAEARRLEDSRLRAKRIRDAVATRNAGGSPATPPASPVVPPPAATDPSVTTKRGVTITLDSVKLGWIVTGVVLVLFLVYHFWGDERVTASVTPSASPTTEFIGLIEDEAKIRASCVRLKYAEKEDAPRCDLLVQRWMKMNGISE